MHDREKVEMLSSDAVLVSPLTRAMMTAVLLYSEAYASLLTSTSPTANGGGGGSGGRDKNKGKAESRSMSPLLNFPVFEIALNLREKVKSDSDRPGASVWHPDPFNLKSRGRQASRKGSRKESSTSTAKGGGSSSGGGEGGGGDGGGDGGGGGSGEGGVMADLAARIKARWATRLSGSRLIIIGGGGNGGGANGGGGGPVRMNLAMALARFVDHMVGQLGASYAATMRGDTMKASKEGKEGKGGSLGQRGPPPDSRNWDDFHQQITAFRRELAAMDQYESVGMVAHSGLARFMFSAFLPCAGLAAAERKKKTKKTKTKKEMKKETKKDDADDDDDDDEEGEDEGEESGAYDDDASKSRTSPSGASLSTQEREAVLAQTMALGGRFIHPLKNCGVLRCYYDTQAQTFHSGLGALDGDAAGAAILDACGGMNGGIGDPLGNFAMGKIDFGIMTSDRDYHRSRVLPGDASVEVRERRGSRKRREFPS
jgi:hypothetical protein